MTNNDSPLFPGDPLTDEEDAAIEAGTWSTWQAVGERSYNQYRRDAGLSVFTPSWSPNHG